LPPRSPIGKVFQFSTEVFGRRTAGAKHEHRRGRRGRRSLPVNAPGRMVWCRELYDRIPDPAPDRYAVVIVGGRELIGARFAFLERLLTIALEHQVGGAPDIDLGYHAAKTAPLQEFNTTDCIACKDACQGGRKMARVLTAEDVVRRIAAECAFVDERGGVGIRLEPAAAIVRQYGEQFRRAARRRQRTPKRPRLL
jgi:hypothetical protein